MRSHAPSWNHTCTCEQIHRHTVIHAVTKLDTDLQVVGRAHAHQLNILKKNSGGMFWVMFAFMMDLYGYSGFEIP